MVNNYLVISQNNFFIGTKNAQNFYLVLTITLRYFKSFGIALNTFFNHTNAIHFFTFIIVSYMPAYMSRKYICKTKYRN